MSLTPTWQIALMNPLLPPNYSRSFLTCGARNKCPRSSGRSSEQNFDVDTGAYPADSDSLHAFLINLIERKAEGTNALTILVLSKARMVDLIHSLFMVSLEDYDSTPELWGIVREVPDEGLPLLIAISPINLSTIDHFYGTLMGGFESHVTGINSVLQRDLDSQAHSESIKEDNGATIIVS